MKPTQFNVIVPCSGLATRLMPFSQAIPKVLLNVGTDTPLKMIYEYWTNIHGFNTLYVSASKKFIPMLRAYINEYGLTKVELIQDDLSDGSYNAIQRIISKHLNDFKDKSVFLNWSDVIPNSELRFDEFKDINTVLCFGASSRYTFKNDKISFDSNSNGNVVGLYYITNPTTVFSIVSEKGVDFIEADHQITNAVELADVIDFGDIKKLNYEVKRSNAKCREFNSIEFFDEYVIKSSKNSTGDKLSSLEFSWYSAVNSLSNIAPKAKLLSPGVMKIDRVKGTELKHATVDVTNVLSTILNELHQIETISVHPETLINDLQKEVVEKSENRKALIDGYINAFGSVKYVNGVELLPFNEIIAICFDRLKYLNRDTSQYSLIHGDLNFSNIFLNERNEIKIIDPRGYFGNSNIYGLPSYDMSKILYGLSGYDEFNDEYNFYYEKTNESLRIELPINLESVLDIKDFSEEHHYWLAIIWINLGGYFKNNPLKSILAYYYGMYLATLLIEQRYPKKINNYNELYYPVSLKVYTKCPFKYQLTDNLSKETYVGSPSLKYSWRRENE